jgi:hypothetical protein
MKAGQVVPKPMTDAMLVHTYQPDIVMFQEAWQKTMCGSYLDPAAVAGDDDINNWSRLRIRFERQRDAAARTNHCCHEREQQRRILGPQGGSGVARA